MAGRLDLIDSRIEHAFDRIETIERRLDAHAEAIQSEEESEAQMEESRETRVINWAMLGLFVIEVVIGFVEIWMMRHG